MLSQKQFLNALTPISYKVLIYSRSQPEEAHIESYFHEHYDSRLCSAYKITQK